MSEAGTVSGVKNVVLVHGGFVDGSGWQGVYETLKKDGYAVSVVQNPTISLGDDVAVTNMLRIFGMQSQTLPAELLDDFRFHFKAGHGGYPLVGTPEQIVDQIDRISALGVDGLLMSWVDYLTECKQWIERVLPLMEQAGQRKPFTSAPCAPA